MIEMDTPVLKAIRERRSIRKFTEDAISREDILTILEAGRWAPSGLNNQPWRFLVIPAGDPRQEKLAECTKYAHVVRQSAALICITLDKERMYSEMKDHQGAGACIQNMLLAVHDLGLGAVWLGQIINDQDAALEAAGIPDTQELQAVLAIGQPAQDGTSSRLELADLMLEEF